MTLNNMEKENDIFNDSSLKDDIQDLVAIEQGILRTSSPLPDMDAELEKIVGKKKRDLTLVKHLASAAIGAAAMLALMFIWQWTTDDAKDEAVATTEMNVAATDTGIASIQTSAGETITLTLADGTEVKLNSNSRLTYPHGFAGTERKVQLTGEAFFRVKHDEARPFVVDAGGLLTKDLGTSFNICAYADKDCRVTLVEGSVSVTPKKEKTKVYTLTPGQQFSLREAEQKESAHVEIEEVNVEETTAWVDGIYYYRDQPLEHILDDLARQYRAHVEFRNTKAKDIRLDFSANRNGTLAEAADLLNGLGITRVSIQGDTIVVE